MSKILLRHLSVDDIGKFKKANSENWEENFSFAHYFNSLAHDDVHKYIDLLPDFSKGLHIPKEHVPCTFLFAFNEDNEIVGRTSIRHKLTEFLMKDGGHVGYGVVPSKRKKGYATSILKETLGYIKKNLPELDKVLVTCDDDNVGSIKTIEKNSGVLENILDLPSGVKKRRYWINII